MDHEQYEREIGSKVRKIYADWWYAIGKANHEFTVAAEGLADESDLFDYAEAQVVLHGFGPNPRLWDDNRTTDFGGDDGDSD